MNTNTNTNTNTNIKITIFQSKKTQSKIPVSPFDNNQFIFETKEVQSIEDVYDYLTSYFVLNIPLTRNIKTYRRKKDLKDYFVQKLEYIILDIDKIKTVSDKELCIKFFKDNNYCCILGESRNPLNLKGVLKVDCTVKESKLIVKEINEKINGFGNYDLTVTNYVSYQAPTLKRTIYYKNLQGKIYPTPIVTEESKTISENIPPKIPKNIQELCKNEFEIQGFTFCEKNEDFIKVSHYSEKKSPKGFRWYPNNPFKMHHWNTDRNVDIWEIITKSKEYKEYIKQKNIKKIQEIIPNQNSDSEINERYLSKYPEIVSEFLKNKDILKIQSPMGTGKSGIIEEVIKQADKLGYRIMFITNRVSLADDISKKYKNIKHYQGTELEGNNYEIGDNLVVQIDSLWKPEYSTKYFDVVILDEFSTLINQLLSLEKEGKPHKKNIITKFFSLKKKKLVIADAILFDNQIRLFSDNIISIENKYRDEIEIEFFKQKDNFIYDLIETAKNEPCTVSSGSLTIIKIIELLLTQNNISYKVISGETSKKDKELIYKSFKNKTPISQVIIYSPTITVGISILNEINKHYHYDSGESMSVLQSLQMTKRTRKSKVIKMFLDQRQKYLSTDLNQIQSTLRDYSEMDEDGDIIGIKETGKKLAELIRTDNILENLHKESFKRLMKFQFKMDISDNIKLNKTEIPLFVQKTSKIVKEKEKKKNLDIFEMYRKMSPEEISEIEMKAYGTSKEEQLIKMFEIYKTDPAFRLFKENNIMMLIKEELKTPGIIDNLKNIIQDFGYDAVLSNKIKKVLKRKEFKKELKKYGYKRERNRWHLNPIIYGILENLISF